MAELSGEHLIEVRVGTGKPPTVRVRPGETIGPMSLGAEGAWRLEAPGVTREHAEVYFDGRQLFVRSLSAVRPVLVGGRPVPNAWTAIEPPCELMLGEARLWFGPDLAGQPDASVQRAAARAGLLEDDDNVATSVAESAARPWGDVGALVQLGIDASRNKVSGAPPLMPYPPPVTPPPMPYPPPMTAPAPTPFWPAAAAAPEPAPEGDAIEAPSNSRRTDNSAMTRIAPLEPIAKRPQDGSHSMEASGSYPQAQRPQTAGSSPGASAFGAPAPSSLGSRSPAGGGADYRPTLSEGAFGSTAILQGSPLPLPAYNPPPASFPMFGAPPSLPPVPSSYPGLPVQGSGTTTLNSGTLRSNLPISTEGLERSAPVQRKSGWREMPGPRKLLILLSPLLVGAVLILFIGDELGIGPEAKGATRKLSATPSAAAQHPPAPSATPTEPILPPDRATPPGPSRAAVAPSAASTLAATPSGNPAAVPTVGGDSAGPPPDAPPPTPPDPSSASEKVATGKTLQREAADAVAAGSLARAAEIYEQLAKKYPNKTAYAEAAAILRAKVGRKP